MKKIVMAIAAHPDDLEFSCCGTIAKLIEKGYEAIYVIVSNGENGFKIEHKPRNVRIKIREKEQIDAADVIGVKKIIFLHEKDSFINYNEKIRKKLALLIKKYKPNIVFSFDPANLDFNNINLNHIDHRNTGLMVFDAVFAAKNKYIYPGKPWKIDNIFFFGGNKPNYYEDITNKINLKLKALSMHQSQFTDFDKVKKFLIERLSKGYKKYKYSEAFRIVKIEQIT